MTFNRLAMRTELTRDEGLRLKPYLDTVGKTTIGVGRNLSDRGITQAEADLLLNDDIDLCEHELDQHAAWWRQMADPRQRAILNMCFQLGWGGLSGFKNTLALLESGKYAQAADNALKSLWARQVPERAKRVTDMLRNG